LKKKKRDLDGNTKVKGLRGPSGGLGLTKGTFAGATDHSLIMGGQRVQQDSTRRWSNGGKKKREIPPSTKKKKK